jgi:hypothetical protein
MLISRNNFQVSAFPFSFEEDWKNVDDGPPYEVESIRSTEGREEMAQLSCSSSSLWTVAYTAAYLLCSFTCTGLHEHGEA